MSGPEHWPVGPLITYLERTSARSPWQGRVTQLAMAKRCRVEPRQLHRWLSRGWLSTWHADQAAVAAGIHPALLWPDWYSRPLDGAETAERLAS